MKNLYIAIFVSTLVLAIDYFFLGIFPGLGTMIFCSAAMAVVTILLPGSSLVKFLKLLERASKEDPEVAEIFQDIIEDKSVLDSMIQLSIACVVLLVSIGLAVFLSEAWIGMLMYTAALFIFYEVADLERLVKRLYYE